LLVMCLVLTLAAGLTACNRGRSVEAAREDRPRAVSQSEQDFMMKAAQAHMAGNQVAGSSLQKSCTNDSKGYANKIKCHHTEGPEDQTDLMKDKNVRQPRSIAADTQQDISRMNTLSGGEFDREFVNMMVSDHQKAIELFRDQQSSAQNRDVKKY